MSSVALRHSPDMAAAGADAAAFCTLAPRSDGTVMRGQASAEFGHRIASRHPVSDGIFAGWQWDGTRLEVCNDRYGIQPLFFASLPGGGVGVSPSPAKLIDEGTSAELDVAALAVFFRLGFFVGDDTPFAAIKAVPPAAEFAWTRAGLTCGARYPDASRTATLSRDDAIDAYIELFARAMAKRQASPEGCVVPVSGGRDSRHILLELERTGCLPRECVTAIDYPPDPVEDPRIAASLCQALGIRHTVIDQQLSPYHAQRRKNVETHFCSSVHAWFLVLADYMNGQVASTYDGIAGDVLSQSKFLSADLDAAFHSRDVDAICAALLARQASNFVGVPGILGHRLQHCLDPAIARQRLAREVARHLDQPNPAASFIFWNRTRREIALAPFALLNRVPHVYAPFLDHALFDFLTSLPSGMLLDHRFHDDTIARAYPQFAHIPYAHNAAAGSEDGGIRKRFMQELAHAFMLRKPSPLVKTLGPRSRMLASVVSSGHVNPWISPLVIYLDQLGSLVNSARATGRPRASRTRRQIPAS